MKDAAGGLRLPGGRRILVTGASGGIGRALLSLLSPSAVHVGAHYHHNRAALERAVRALKGPARFMPLFADLCRPQSAGELVEAFCREAGGIDALVQLNGGVTAAEPGQLTPEQWARDIDLNLTSVFFLAREAMRRMPRSGGRIVLTGTASAAHGGGRGTIAYGVAKAGVECLAKGLAREGAPRNILVNALCPGLIKTGFHATRLGRSARQLRERAALVPLKRAGSPEEAAGPIVFLLSDLARYITGQCIAVSGGDWL